MEWAFDWSPAARTNMEDENCKRVRDCESVIQCRAKIQVQCSTTKLSEHVRRKLEARIEIAALTPSRPLHALDRNYGIFLVLYLNYRFSPKSKILRPLQCSSRVT